MRIVPFLINATVTIALVFALEKKWGPVPPLGRFLSPQHGFWQNAEPVDHDFSERLSFPQLKGQVNVYIDDRLVPHVFAEKDEDAYFVQGFLHAKYRLWQMEFQTLAAAGRISEKLGFDPRFLKFDREQRRLGMVYAAENALAEAEKNPLTKMSNDAYTAGVNAYIETLTESTLPLEYKLLDYKPEKWSNLKISLFLKQMSKTLAGSEKDLEYTNAKSVFSEAQMNALFPQVPDSLVPIIPKGTLFEKPGIIPQAPASADSLYFGKDTAIRNTEIFKPSRINGSNNWALSGQKTRSGYPILCNDPHLELTLPSIWYEMQLNTPTMNAYGATFPGSPSIIIGFTDEIAFGFTNSQRDVKDYYQVRFKDASKREYWFNGSWQPTKLRIDTFKVKEAASVYDTIAYTIFGPVMYDESFTKEVTGNTALAVRWTAHDPSNEGLMWMKLNRAKNYMEYEEAIKTYSTPGQNMLFAAKNGDIALWQQARFPARWQGQGLYVMPGEDSSYMWQGFIPQRENPHIINPVSGYIQSANQRPVDSSYPYFIPGGYIVSRGITITNELEKIQQATPKDMMALQNNTYSSFAADAVPFLLKYIDGASLTDKEKTYVSTLAGWNYHVTAEAKAPTIFQVWMDSLESVIWRDEFSRIPAPKPWPDEQTLLERLLKDSADIFIDNIYTAEKETIQQQVVKSLKLAAQTLMAEEKEGGIAWWIHKKPAVYHLLKTILPFSRQNLKVGGWSNTINAITKSHGPSWRMIVHLTPTIEAYGIYPGGQSGNPGSKYYDSFLDPWVAGNYYSLWMMKKNETHDQRVKWTLTFSKA